MFRKLIDWGFMHNVWAWFHIMAGGFFARIVLIGFDKWQTLFIIFMAAVLWEVFEFFYDGMTKGMIDIYGSLERWAYDCAGDVLGALIMALIVVM